MVKYTFDRGSRVSTIDGNDLLVQASKIRNDFRDIWINISERIDLDISFKTAISELKNLVIYEALDGNRSTLCQNRVEDQQLEGAFYAIRFIHTLKSLGSKNCYIMIHTSYNRGRGKNEFNNILQSIKTGGPFIKEFGMARNVFCSCICSDKNHELIGLLEDVTKSTRGGEFCVHFLFDYSEEWAITGKGQEIMRELPDIDVHIRHTKFQFSGGWIPSKMSRSVFLYSQNGSMYSNWNSYEIVTLVALSLLAKLIHKEEGLTKVYRSNNEIEERYRLRELKLFNKVIELQDNPKKLCMIGSPVGIYQFYY